MTWNERLRESITAFVASGGATLAAALLAELSAQQTIGLTLAAGFGAFANGMGINPQIAHRRHRSQRQS